MRKKTKKRFVIGVSGASGAVYAVRLLELFRDFPEIETHLVISGNARKLMKEELGKSARTVDKMASASYSNGDLDAPVSSGSFKTDGMVVIPCSMKTLSAIANSYADNLLVRAADVTLKERRRLVLVVRETPLHSGHLELMLRASRLGAIILPAAPGFYSKPESISDLVDQIVGKVLDVLGIENDILKRWKSS